MEQGKTHIGLGVHEGSVLHGKRGVLLLVSSLFILSLLLTVIGLLFSGGGIWALVFIVLWLLFLVYLFRFSQGYFGLWKISLVFLVYVILLSFLFFSALSHNTPAGGVQVSSATRP